MYTAQYSGEELNWSIYDPDGDYICTVLSEAGAEAILSHLNRGL